MTDQKLNELIHLVRYWILTSTTKAGSGHPTSSLSATELMVGLMFGGMFRYDVKRPHSPYNDQLIFSKGHAAPLLYSLWAAAGAIPEKELYTLREFSSRLEGHPTPNFPYHRISTGSLGQGLSAGVGLAINAQRLDRTNSRTYVLLGDGEMAEGQVWEAMLLAAHYRLHTLTAIVDVNGLGQTGQTMFGHQVNEYRKRASAFGWNAIVVNGHDLRQVLAAYRQAEKRSDRPTMIIAKTKKGHAIPAVEGDASWHGKALPEDLVARYQQHYGTPNRKLRGRIPRPRPTAIRPVAKQRLPQLPTYTKQVATREAYGEALQRIGGAYPNIVALDADVSSSTKTAIFANAYPERFLEMYIAEQNMMSTAVGLSLAGKIPFVSTFAAFWIRAHDQIRMAGYSRTNVKCVGSHAGVSIGNDGPSQMGLEDIAVFRDIIDSTVLYPADAYATHRLVEAMASRVGLMYLRTTRSHTPLLYKPTTKFQIGGSHVLRRSTQDRLTIVTAGITLYEALAAADTLAGQGIPVRVIDCYSIKPLDRTTLISAARETRAILTVEDHYQEGGLGEAVLQALADEPVRTRLVAVQKLPRSGDADTLLDYEGLSARALIRTIKKFVATF